ncbi:hypothetical protein M378DRAFT_159661 [Amanita muscaria Koide BX008]|uniref:Uncharacterized protein n=1 Tax=Amanita muscaria (strain Koide BX008) TaxID=946122 RepID=A0A0C2TJS0_AMAMK|nr:hypothetical protein M378DRAFT_159661 [Amanita muscaria Koide BX008]
MSDLEKYNHDDFEVVRTDKRFGGFEELKLKKDSTNARFLRKSLTPDSHNEIDDLLSLQKLVMKDGCSGTIHPMYTHNERKWVLMSVPEEHYGITGLAV